jgi:ferredoxin
MKYRIGEKCIQCFACIRSRICPEEAIIECNGVYSIDAGKCTDCGICYSEQKYFCPVRAIVDNKRAVRRKTAKKPRKGS